MDSEDDSLATGWLRCEYVLVDYDGDGIAERRLIYRFGRQNPLETKKPIRFRSPRRARSSTRTAGMACPFPSAFRTSSASNRPDAGDGQRGQFGR